MHMILKWAPTGSLAGTDTIAVQQRRKVEAWQDNESWRFVSENTSGSGARSVLIGAEKRTDLFSRWVCSLVERRGYWRAVVAIAAKNARLCWASLHYGDDFRLYSAS
jgi:transposase